jgi:membrane protein DedA with SNARE-associated domain
MIFKYALDQKSNMSFLSSEHLTKLISTQGYWVVGVVIGLESIGVPLPGEIVLVLAAIYAGTTHALDISLVIVAASAGAFFGNNLGFWIGQEVGYRLLLRFGRSLHLTEQRIKLGQYLFLRHGGKVVFFGRFFVLLRTLSALLAGINRMEWWRFLAANAAGSIFWATVYGLGAYYLGVEATHVARPVEIALGAIGFGTGVAVFLVVRRYERVIAVEAERVLPGPLRPLH